ncbi:Glycosyl transferase family 2 [Chryseobacterium sp. RU37D]|uniref:glycosyltransferase family 2 protein n=1 Tax=Chryseobacterium sp. RU37D TaxID=1907397 RepID=UPI0009571C5E|nr:glycosyltransferase [Chryseobacterium sp. RU37D]SIQ04464.1 Glycosyl transferase family 2 [Chryseobacterium sp. RU37D]
MNPTVSVVMITYGHEDYIEESINGVLSQTFNAEIELIISDDCSPDNTETVIKKIIGNHPNGHWIKYIKHTENKGAIPNFVWAISQAKGKYIAICEGDDYWTDHLKLQKQVDFLEEHPEYSLTFHKIKELTTREEKFTYPNPDTEEIYTIEDLAKENFIITVSVVFRKNMEVLPDWLKYSPIGDYPLHMLNASFGLIKYFPQEMATYRVGSGMWSTQNKVDQMVNTMYCLRFLLLHFKKNKEVHQNLSGQYNNFRTALIQPFDHKKALDVKLKDYRYIENITSMGNLLKMMKIKIAKKLKF